MSVRVVFDSYALLALIEDDPGAQIVDELINSGKVQLYLSAINLGEIYYIMLRRRSIEAADEVIEALNLEESIEIVEAVWPRIKAAAKIKAMGRLSYADSFVIALANELKASIVTGDPEIISLAGELAIEVIKLQ